MSVRSKLHDLSHSVKGCKHPHRHELEDYSDSSDDERFDMRRGRGRSDVYSSDDESDRDYGFEDASAIPHWRRNSSHKFPFPRNPLGKHVKTRHERLEGLQRTIEDRPRTVLRKVIRHDEYGDPYEEIIEKRVPRQRRNFKTMPAKMIKSVDDFAEPQTIEELKK